MKIIIVGAILVAIGATVSHAQTVLPVTATQVSLPTTEDTEKLDYLMLELPEVEVPPGMKLEEAILSLYMDAFSTSTIESQASETVTLEVYPYKGISKGGIDPDLIGTSAMKRTVQVGQDKPIRVYVSDFVSAFVANQAVSRRLLVGAISGQRAAVFEAKTLPGTATTKATLTVYFSRIEDAAAEAHDH